MNSFQIKWRVHGEREKERGRLPKDSTLMNALFEIAKD